MSNGNEKGRLLEEGVQIIERHILSAEARIKDSELAIETRKIINHLGVRHEIDLYVRVIACHGYDAVFVFECKNWKDKVGKNEIIIFAEKIQVSAAQRGFFIATAFTQDAIAQAELNPRIQLVTATAEEMEHVMLLNEFHVLVVEYLDTSLNLFHATKADFVAPSFDVDAAIASIDGTSLDLKAYLLTWQNDAQNRRMARWGTGNEPAGDYPVDTEEKRIFEAGSLIVNGESYASAKLSLSMVARVTRPRILARVDVHGRGTAYQLESVKAGEGDLKLWVATSSAPRPK
jgi:Restriction endonuclease